MIAIHKVKGYAWIIVVLSAFLLFYKYILQVYPGLITNDIMSSFRISPAEAGAMIAITFWTIVIAQLFAGLLLDKFGFRSISSLSLIISSIGLLLFIYAANHHSVALGYLSRILIGFGISFATVSYIKAVSVWFSAEKFTFVCSFLATASMLGAIAGQAPLAYLITRTGSWQYALVVCACVGIGGAIIYWLVVRDDNPDNRPYLDDKSSMSWGSIREVLSNRNNWLLTLYAGLSFTTVDAFAGLWGNNYFREQYGVSSETAAGMISMIFVGMAIGSPIIGKLAEKLDRRIPLMIGFHIVGTIALAIVLLTYTSPFIAGFCLFVFGFCLGIYMLSFAIGRRINALAVAATVAALINTGEPIFGALFDPLIGYFLELSWHGAYITNTGEIIHYAANAVPEGAVKHFSVGAYHIAFSILTASMVISLMLLFFVKDRAYKEKA